MDGHITPQPEMMKSVRPRASGNLVAKRVAKNQNAEAYQKIHFRPRILRKVALADAKTTILGKESSIPVFISPAYVGPSSQRNGESES